MSAFKLLSYNIMSGCFNDYSPSSVITERFDLLQEAIKQVKADFVGLVDTFKWKEIFTPEELKDKFNYQHIFTIDMEDTRVERNIGVAVMTDLNVRKFNVLRAFNRNYIETVLDEMNIYTCYFDDVSEDTRLSEVKSLLEQVNKPAIIHGDLNTFAKEDLSWIDQVSPIFERDNVELSKKLKPYIDGMRRGEVVETLKAGGFMDSAREWAPTMPTKLFPVKADGPFLRVDYIFHSEGTAVDKTTVEKGDLFDKVSDHFPLSAIISY